MTVITCPSCNGKYGGSFPKSSVKMADGVVEFSCDTCLGRGRVERSDDGTLQPIPDIVDALQGSRNAYFVSHPEIFTKRRK